MILQLSNGAPAYNGRVNNTLMVNTNGRLIARTRSRQSNTKQRQRFVPPWRTTSARAEFSALALPTQTEWNDWAEENQAFPIDGSPRYVDGETYFINYLTVLRLVDPLAAVPSVPLSLPNWQTRPKFVEFASWVSDTYTVTAATEMEAGTVILATGLPPTKTLFKPEFYGEQFIGTHTFEFGLYEDEETDFLHDLMESAFGPVDDTMKIWNRLWEVYPDTGFIRTIKDPCTPDPDGDTPPPSAQVTLVVENSRDFLCDDVTLTMYDEYLEEVGSSIIYGIEAFGTESVVMSLDMEYDNEPWELYWEANWSDGEWADYSEPYEGEEPFDVVLVGS